MNARDSTVPAISTVRTALCAMEGANTCSTKINRAIETNRVSLVRHVARTRKTNKYRLFVRHPAEKRRLGRPRRRRITVKWDLRIRTEGCGLDSAGSGEE